MREESWAAIGDDAATVESSVREKVDKQVETSEREAA